MKKIIVRFGLFIAVFAPFFIANGTASAIGFCTDIDVITYIRNGQVIAEASAEGCTNTTVELTTEARANGSVDTKSDILNGNGNLSITSTKSGSNGCFGKATVKIGKLTSISTVESSTCADKNGTISVIFQ